MRDTISAMQEYPFTDDDMAKIKAASDTIARVAKETARRGKWDSSLERAHQGLGVIMAIQSANGWTPRQHV
jgi:hypothetical protein